MRSPIGSACCGASFRKTSKAYAGPNTRPSRTWTCVGHVARRISSTSATVSSGAAGTTNVVSPSVPSTRCVKPLCSAVPPARFARRTPPSEGGAPCRERCALQPRRPRRALAARGAAKSSRLSSEAAGVPGITPGPARRTNAWPRRSHLVQEVRLSPRRRRVADRDELGFDIRRATARCSVATVLRKRCSSRSATSRLPST